MAFCNFYLKTGNPKEAAVLAGYKSCAERKAMQILSIPAVKKKIDELYKEKKKNFAYSAAIGYERLAFGNISDAIKLVFAENINFEEIEKMNLFNICEIKKPRDGAMEIKFFDRLRALEKLEQINHGSSSQEESFYKTLENSIENLSTNKLYDEEEKLK